MRQMHGTAPTIETARLVLRAHNPSDFPASSAMWADPSVVRYISGTPFTPEESWSRLLRYAGHWSLLGYGYWLVEAKEDSRFVGEVGFANLKRNMTPSAGDAPEAGWVLNASEHGKGYATEAVASIVSWADRTLIDSATFCILDPLHASSINVARKVGYSGDVVGRYRNEPTLVLWRQSGIPNAASTSGR